MSRATNDGAGNPYIGPRPFKEGERLYGRKAELDQLTDELLARRIVVLHSPSGAGKSSLIRAGLLPRLRRAEFDICPIIRLNQAPLDGTTINRFSTSAVQSLEQGGPTRKRLDVHAPREVALSTCVAQRTAATIATHGRSPLLIFDQFEEVLTIDPLDVASRVAFFDDLGETLGDGSVWALIAIREDYLPALAPYVEHVPTSLGNTFRLDLLDLESAAAAITGPARRAGREYTEPAVRQLCTDLATVQVQQRDGSFKSAIGVHVEPMQLQVVCRRLWEQLDDDQLEIGVGQLRSAGNVDEALSEYYTQRVEATAAGERRLEHAIRGWFNERLINLASKTRSQVLRAKDRSDGLDNAVIDRLLDTHLVRAEERAGATWYELAHDRLIRPILRNNTDWFNSELHAMQRQAWEWERQGRPEHLLLAGQPLADAIRWAHEQPTLLPIERDLLERSQRLERTRRLKRVAALAAVATILIAGVGASLLIREAHRASAVATAAIENSNRETARALEATREASEQRLAATAARDDAKVQAAAAERTAQEAHRAVAAQRTAQREAQAAQLAAKAAEQLARDQTELAVSAAHRASEQAGRARDAEREARVRAEEAQVQQKRAREASLKAQQLDELQTARALALRTLSLRAEKPDLVALLAVTAHRLNARNDGPPEQPEVFEALRQAAVRMALHPTPPGRLHPDQVRTITIADDVLATGCDDGIVRIFSDAGEPRPLNVTGSPIRALAARGRALAAGDSGGNVRVWDLTGTTAPARWQASADVPVRAVAFVPGTSDLASGSADGTVHLWRIPETLSAAGVDGRVVVQATPPITALAVSSNGRTLYAASGDGVHVVDIATATTREKLGVGRVVTALALSRRTLAFGDDAGALTVIDIESGEQLRQQPAHDSGVTSLTLSPDGDQLASTGFDGHIRLWLSGQGPAVDLPGHAGWVWTAAFSPDGRTLYSGGADRELRAWPTRTTNLVDELCRQIPRELNDDEWKLYLGDVEPFPPCPADSRQSRR